MSSSSDTGMSDDSSSSDEESAIACCLLCGGMEDARDNRYAVKISVCNMLNDTAYAKDVELLKKLLAEAHNTKHPGERTLPMELAASKGHYECVQLLLQVAWEQFSSAEEIKEHVCPPSILHSAASNGHTKVVELLADTLFENASAKETGYALAGACRNREIECIKLLASKFPNHINDGGLFWFTFLSIVAATFRDLRVLEILLDAGDRADARTNFCGITPLHFVCFNGDLDKTRFLLERKVDINAQDDSKQTALHSGASSGSVDVVKLLLSNGADPSIKDSNKISALTSAAREGHLEVVKLLADVTTHDCGSEAVRHAALGSSKDVIIYLLSKGYPTFTETAECALYSHPWLRLLIEGDYISLYPAYKKEDLSSIVRLLLENGTPLQEFAKRKYFITPHVNTLKVFLDFGLMELGWNSKNVTFVDSFSKAVRKAIAEFEFANRHNRSDQDKSEKENFFLKMIMYQNYFPFVSFTCIDTQSVITWSLHENVVQNIPKLSEICRWTIRQQIAFKYGLVAPKHAQKLPLPGSLQRFLNYQKSVKRANPSPNSSDNGSPCKKTKKEAL